MILDSSSFPLFHGGQVFHELVCPLTVILPQIFFRLITLFSHPVFFSLFHAPLDVVVHFPVFLRSFRFESFLSQFFPFVTNNTNICSEIEENMRKNNSKRAYQLVKDLTTVKQGKATTVQNRSGKCLTEEQEILNRWTEYYTELYNHKANGDPSVLDCPQTDTADDHPILRKEVGAALQSSKKGKSAGVDNVTAEMVQVGGEDIITALTTKIWQTGEWSTPWTQSLVITLPKKGNVQQC